MIIESNPYASPSNTATDVASADFRDLFLSWERLRIVFNGVLVALTLLCGMASLADPKFWWTAMLGGFVTNVCFCVGPILDGYVTWLFGRRVRWVQVALFLIGQTFAAALAGTVILNAFPNRLTNFAF